MKCCSGRIDSSRSCSPSLTCGRECAVGVAFVFLFFFVFHSLIGGEIAVEFLHRTGGAESVVAGGNVNRGLVEDGRNHLRGDEALPDHLVELEHRLIEIRAERFRACEQHRWGELLRALPARLSST